MTQLHIKRADEYDGSAANGNAVKYKARRTDTGEWVYGQYLELGFKGKVAGFIVPDQEIGRNGDAKLPPMMIGFTLNKDIFLVDMQSVEVCD